MTAKSLKKHIMENSFWLSLLLHLLLLIAMLLVIKLQPQEQHQKQPHLYVPSYIYQGAITPAFKPRPNTPPKSVEKPVIAENTLDTAKIEATPTTQVKPQTLAVTKKINPKKSLTAGLTGKPKSLFAASTELLHQEQMHSITNRSDEEPILLIGDTNKIADPLIKLMARSLSAHFRYPDNEGMLGIKGRVLVLLTLHPEGYYSDVEMVKTSENPNLDAAALYAVNTAPHVLGASDFIKQPKRFLVGFVFE